MKTTNLIALGAAASLLFASPLLGQREGMDLSPFAANGQTVSPFFEGWYANADGSITYSFGYYNRNLDQTIEIPLGEDNFIEPAEYDGVQPTTFKPVNYSGYNGRRERGVFGVTVPSGYTGDVVWTLRMNGQELRVPARAESPAYELSTHRMAMGSFPPRVWFNADGADKSGGPEGVTAESILQAKVGEPIDITFFASDEGSARDESVPLNVSFWKHQGPGEVTFAEDMLSIQPVDFGSVTATATFDQAGDYMVRIRVDNHRAPDSAHGDQCCWSNGFQRVTVTD